MNRRSLAALILINAVLLAALVVTTLTPPARAQFGAAGNYLMVAGQVRGRNNQNAIYLIDQQSSRIVAVLFNSGTDKLQFIASRSFAEDARAGEETGERGGR